MLTALRAVAARAPASPALGGPGHATLDYAGLLDRVEAVARGLAGLGVGAGDRVAVLAHNDPRTLVLLFACARLGAMLLPVNWRLAAPEIDWLLADAAPRLLVTGAACPHPAPPGTLACAIEALPQDGPGLPRGPVGGAAESLPVLLVYTSGTTGRPKGAVLTQGAMLANAALSRDMHGLTAADHVLTVLPLFHVGGLNIQTVPALLTGARVTLHPRFDPGLVLRTLAGERPSLTVLVPATLQALAAHAGFASADLSSLRAVTTGSTTVPEPVTRPFTARGVPVLQVYGATETAPIAIYSRVGEEGDHTGRPGPGVEAIAVDDHGRPVGRGAPGEIWLRGPQLFGGYWRDAAASAEAMAGGWFHTGDIGTERADGTWIVHDRKKNLIVSGGENIYPAEIERVLHAMAGVAEAAVVGVPDPRWQEVPEAHVVAVPGAGLTEAAVIARLGAELARYKVPRRVHFRDSLPRNAMGKVQHALLRGVDE